MTSISDSHDAECEAEFIADAGLSTACGCATRADSGAGLVAEALRPPDCICAETHTCAESDNQCPACIHLDIYDPCPVIGFGCGNVPGCPPCDCCTPEQREAATP